MERPCASLQRFFDVFKGIKCLFKTLYKWKKFLHFSAPKNFGRWSPRLSRLSRHSSRLPVLLLPECSGMVFISIQFVPIISFDHVTFKLHANKIRNRSPLLVGL